MQDIIRRLRVMPTNWPLKILVDGKEIDEADVTSDGECKVLSLKTKKPAKKKKMGMSKADAK